MKLANLVKTGCLAFAANAWSKKTPLNVILSVTNRCPSRCNYCNIPNRQQKELTTSEIFSLIDQISNMGCQRLGLWGGEPLIREDIGEIIDYANMKGLFITLDSNGHLLSKRKDVLKNLGHLVLALDGQEKEHDLNKEEGSFKKVMDAIELSAGKVPLWTITVLTKNNLDSIDFILETARKYGFLATFQLLHHNEILARNQKELSPTNDSYRRVIKGLILKKKNNAPLASSLNYLNHILNWPDYRTPTSSNKINRLKCWAGRLYCNVDTDGSVYPCSLLVEKTSSLNFLEVGFDKAFNNLKTDTCKGCLASCFTEYNYLYSLDANTIIEWLRNMRRTRKGLCRKEKKL